MALLMYPPNVWFSGGCQRLFSIFILFCGDGLLMEVSNLTGTLPRVHKGIYLVLVFSRYKN